MELRGREVLITGATGGLGELIARDMHGCGARLVLTGRRADALEALGSELGAATVQADLSRSDDVDRVIAAVAGADVLVANAGLSASGLLEQFDADELTTAVDVNLRAPMLLAHAAARAMAERGVGHIVFVSSLSGMTGQPGSAVYSATKFGLRGFAQALRAELRPEGVGVSCVLPGFVRGAGMFHNSGASVPWYLGTSPAETVVRAVRTSIERNRGEVVIAPPWTKAMTRFAAAAPLAAARSARLAGGDRITAKIIEDLRAGRAR